MKLTLNRDSQIDTNHNDLTQIFNLTQGQDFEQYNHTIWTISYSSEM